MSVAEHLTAETAPSKATPTFSTWLKAIGAHIRVWATTCADYWSAAATYEDLRRLSDAELYRRGLSRDTLARDVVAACDRHSRGLTD